MAVWTLTHGGVTKQLKEWGLAQMSRQLLTQAPDELAFVHEGIDFDAEPIFPIKSDVSVAKDGVQWFFGRVVQIPCEATAAAERQRYRLQGPWYWLDNLVYQIVWPQGHSTKVLLNVGANGNLITTGAQIRAVLEYAISKGAPIQIGNLEDLIWYIPVDEVRDVTCSEVIRKQLRWHPDVVPWFDYTTTTPTFHARRRANLTPVTLALKKPTSADPDPENDPFADLVITPRYDLQRSVVAIKYEKTSTIDGEEQQVVIQDLAPVGANSMALEALVFTVNLKGISVQTAQADLLCEAIAPNSLDWWKLKFPWLADAGIKNLAFVAGKPVERKGELSLPSELVEGQIADWMDFDSEQEEITGYFTYELWVGGKKVHTPPSHALTFQCVATDAETGSYSALESVQAGDPQPVGLANYLLEALQDLQHEGSYTWIEPEVSGKVGLGNVINFSGLNGGRWAAINAPVQTVEETVDDGTTRIQFGPAGHLELQDLITLLR
jgi:hypothetical protein